MNNSQPETFADLCGVATYLRQKLKDKKYVFVFAHNSTGKTRLSMEFKNIGEQKNGKRDTLYFNAFTEDLFSWDNDLDNNTQSVMLINRESHFFNGMNGLNIEGYVRPLLSRYSDFDFRIDYKDWKISFFRNKDEQSEPISIKVSRGEENIFVWCFFLSVVQLAIDGEKDYCWVKYLYIDDPISSLDDNHAITLASHLAQILREAQSEVKTVISSHHALFFNVMCNEFKRRDALAYFLTDNSDGYSVRVTRDTPFFHHLVLLQQLHEAAESGNLYTYHFNILRNILEKTATFHGFDKFSECIGNGENDYENTLYTRMINVLNHGNYSLFRPHEMMEENKRHFRKILNDFIEKNRFNKELFQSKAKSLQHDRKRTQSTR